MTWKKVQIKNENGDIVNASAPEIISVSRRTDIPAFYMDWFRSCIERGFCSVKNPYNGLNTYVSFENLKFIVFWSKNPNELLNIKDFLDSKGIRYYIQYSLNDYEDEGYEPNVPSITERIRTFQNISVQNGFGTVIWRFDPLMLTDKVDINKLIYKITKIGDSLKGFTEKLVFSFADISNYKNVKKNLEENDIHYIEWTSELEIEFAEKLYKLNNERGWNYELCTCSEKADLSKYGINHNKCIDDELITRIDYKESSLMEHLGMEIHSVSENLLSEEIPENAIMLNEYIYAVRTKANKSSSQRALCGCIDSVDIGMYNTCTHRCVYCYATYDFNKAEKYYRNYKKRK